MKLLVDANLAPRVAARLREAGHEAVHVADLGLLRATDEEIARHAVDAGFVVVSADSDFSMQLALSGAAAPSVVLFRSADLMSADGQAGLLIASLRNAERGGGIGRRRGGVPASRTPAGASASHPSLTRPGLRPVGQVPSSPRRHGQGFMHRRPERPADGHGSRSSASSADTRSISGRLSCDPYH